MPTLDLINTGERMAQNYRHQIGQTIGAYTIKTASPERNVACNRR